MEIPGVHVPLSQKIYFYLTKLAYIVEKAVHQGLFDSRNSGFGMIDGNEQQ